MVIDSVTTLYLAKPAIARSVVMQLKKVLSGTGTTSFLVSQVSVAERGFGGPGVEHIADGIIRLDLDEVDGELKRSMIIWKMRGTKHSMRRHPFDITDKGIIVHLTKLLRWAGDLRWFSMEINLNPVGRGEIHKLEIALLLGTLFRKDVLEMLRDPSERLTWIDSLA